MAGRYRALLIGNSTYPADEHNLQTLKGPVKDIAVLNRALVDRDTGLFEDVDVTLLPEATSTRSIRTLSKFFGSADRDDVLLVYFSGHGKLDQSGRLHLCMQDTETTDLLSTAVSSVRINEFADASRARNVVIVLDCCYAGAFRGGDFGDAVAGPGRYVLSSCRGTQLANDATVENGTSFFTQHLVDGLLNAADHDEDGYVGFSDVYAYIDRRLREAGKQIPQRRVDGDGDLRLARRPQRAELSGGTKGAPEAASTSTALAPRTSSTPSTPAGRRWANRPRRRLVIALTAVILTLAGVVTAVLLTRRSGDSSSGLGPIVPGSGSYTASAPWRLRVDGTDFGGGCTITLIQSAAGSSTRIADRIYDVRKYQIRQTGSFSWQSTDRRCLVTPLAGSGTAVLPFVLNRGSDTDAFAAPPRGVAVQVKSSQSSECDIRLYDATNGDELDNAMMKPGPATRTFDTSGRKTVYLFGDNCVVHLAAG